MLAALTVGLWAPAGAAAPAPGRSVALLLSLRQGSPFPAGIQLAFAPQAGPSWTVGLDFAGGRAGLQSLWGRRVWKLNPDALAVLGVQAGVDLQEDPVMTLPQGAWLGFYIGERWEVSSLWLEFGTALRIPVQQPHQVGWETTASVGLRW